MTPHELLAHDDAGTRWPGGAGLDMDAAYAAALQVRALRIARGEQPRGYKVGFTNRTIWPRYGVYAPIWGTVWNTTLQFCEGEAEVALGKAVEPRIEPECVFGMKATPPTGANLQQLFESIEWVAPGFEVVHSHQGWKFNAADTVADGGLHAKLLVGARQPIAQLAPDASAFEARMAQAAITLSRDGAQVDAGVGSNVLDGPLHALLHFVQALRACPGAVDLQPGDVVTTGTWTDAWPVASGERWDARFDGGLGALAVRFG
jgi:2-oxo-3-hexenedioate decarboxylase